MTGTPRTAAAARTASMLPGPARGLLKAERAATAAEDEKEQKLQGFRGSRTGAGWRRWSEWTRTLSRNGMRSADVTAPSNGTKRLRFPCFTTTTLGTSPTATLRLVEQSQSRPR